MKFANRSEAGRLLAQRLGHLRELDLVVLGLPRGGVPVAFEVARALHAPLDVVLVRKLRVPFQPELALGAVGEGGIRVFNPDVLRATRIATDELIAIERTAHTEVARRYRWLRRDVARMPLAGRTAIIVDDGIATGATARAACQVVAAQDAVGIVVATPVAPRDTVTALRRVADEVVCLQTPPWLRSIAEWYDDFGPTSDEEVLLLLKPALPLTPTAGRDT